ncbi:hypothetical protein [Actinomadura coerulea]|uniref:hypothetical protein n=1 Tax=Actinomadura coerulea TaxID=46159 RepID=UPI0034263B29
MGIHLRHPTGMIFATLAALLAFGRLNGLHTVPDQPEWIAERLAWLVAFGGALAAGGAPAAAIARPRRHARDTTRGNQPGPRPVLLQRRLLIHRG